MTYIRDILPILPIFISCATFLPFHFRYNNTSSDTYILFDSRLLQIRSFDLPRKMNFNLDSRGGESLSLVNRGANSHEREV